MSKAGKKNKILNPSYLNVVLTIPVNASYLNVVPPIPLQAFSKMNRKWEWRGRRSSMDCPLPIPYIRSTSKGSAL